MKISKQMLCAIQIEKLKKISPVHIVLKMSLQPKYRGMNIYQLSNTLSSA
jgi:hypothetical protein